jgi:hypothetical protein
VKSYSARMTTEGISGCTFLKSKVHASKLNDAIW